MLLQPDLSAPIDGNGVISPTAACSIGGQFPHQGVAASAAWPSANRAIYLPFRLASPFLITQLWWWNGVLSGTPNVDVGVFYPQGAKILSTGNTAQSGASTPQAVNVTDTWLQPGLYYMGMVSASATTAFFRVSVGAAELRIAHALQEASASPLPSTMTGVGVTSSYCPIFGLASRAVF